MNFENFGQQPERNFSGEVNSLAAEMVHALQEASPADRATFLELKNLERGYFNKSL